MTTPSKSVNAWIYLGEDDPKGTNYYSPNSEYQSLINYGVYNSVDMLFICFYEIVPTSDTTIPQGNGTDYTLQIMPYSHPEGYTNQDYMNWVLSDSKQVNPNIKTLVTLNYGNSDAINMVVNAGQATSFANNLVTFLQHYGIDGFDIDWEPNLSSVTTPANLGAFLQAIGTAFAAQSSTYYLTLSPSTSENMNGQGTIINNNVSFLNLQTYGGAYPQEFTKPSVGINANLLAYGGLFENSQAGPYTAQQVQQGYNEGGYTIATTWRLNSENFNFEQASQMVLYQLIYGAPTTFNDTNIVGAAGNTPIVQLVIRSGDVLDSITATNSGDAYPNMPNITLAQHGGNGGNASTVQLASGDVITQVSGYTGTWFGWNCVLQITLTTQGGKTYGPFGTMNNATSKTPFTFNAPSGQSIGAFSGTVITVPLAGGGTTEIIGSLAVATIPN